MCGFIAQLVEHRTGIVEVMGSNPVEALIFFRLLLSSCLNWKIYCDDHTSLSFKVCNIINCIAIKGARGNALTFEKRSSEHRFQGNSGRSKLSKKLSGLFTF